MTAWGTAPLHPQGSTVRKATFHSTVEHSPADIVGDVLHRLVDAIDAVADNAVMTHRSTNPQDFAEWPGLVEDVRAGTSEAVHVVVDCMRCGRQVTDEEKRKLARLGRQRARQGIAPDAVRRTLELAHRALLDHASTLLGDPATGARGDHVSALLRRAFDAALEVSIEVLRGYEGFDGWQVPATERAEAALVDRVLETRWRLDSEIESHASTLGLHIAEGAHLLVVVPLERARGSSDEAAQAIAREFPRALVGAMRWRPVQHSSVLAGRVESPKLAGILQALATTWLARIVHIGPVSLRELAQEYELARDNLTHVKHVGSGPCVVDVGELELLHALSDKASVRDHARFVQRVLGQVFEADGGEELLRIIDALTEGDGSTSTISRATHVTSRTVTRRFNRISRLTGLSLDNASHRLRLVTAARLFRMLADELRTGNTCVMDTDKSALLPDRQPVVRK